MVQIVENWSRIIGWVEEWQPPPRGDEPGTLTVRIDKVEDVNRQPGSPYPNLLADNVGRTLEIQVPATAWAGLEVKAGGRIELDVRRGRSADQVFARPGRIRLGGDD